MHHLTTPTVCDECGEVSANAVEVGDGREHEPGTARVCHACLLETLRLFADSNDPRKTVTYDTEKRQR